MTRSEFAANVCVALAPRFGNDGVSINKLYEWVEAITEKHAQVYGGFDSSPFSSYDEDTPTLELPVDFPSGPSYTDKDWSEGQAWASGQVMNTPGDINRVFDLLSNPEVVRMTATAYSGAYAYIASRANELLTQKTLAGEVEYEVRRAYERSDGIDLNTVLDVSADMTCHALKLKLVPGQDLRAGKYSVWLKKI